MLVIYTGQRFRARACVIHESMSLLEPMTM